MFSLLLLSMVLSAPATATQPALMPDDSVVHPPPLSVLVQPEAPLSTDEDTRPFDAMEIQPDSDICYKIRAYVFSTDRVPKFLRETTCGPKPSAPKHIDGIKPGGVPSDIKEKPREAPER